VFGLIADEVLYFKVDDGNRADFAAVGLLPFSYQRQGKSIQLSFSLRVSSN
jgi:DNA transformation protein